MKEIHPWVDAPGPTIQVLFLDGMDELANLPVREVGELGLRYPRLKIQVAKSFMNLTPGPQID
jgi:hypothetical protein